MIAIGSALLACDAMIRRSALLLSVLALSACAHDGFTRHNAGTAQLWIGDQLAVEMECIERGVVITSNDTRIYGCTHFAGRTIISVSDPRVIAHEWCHWTMHTESHAVCLMPVLP